MLTVRLKTISEIYLRDNTFPEWRKVKINQYIITGSVLAVYFSPFIKAYSTVKVRLCFFDGGDEKVSQYSYLLFGV